MQMTTVFDGFLPPSVANPGGEPGVSVVVWTPTRDGVYSSMVSLPDEPGAPFNYNPVLAVDLDDVGGAFIDPLAQGPVGGLTNEVQDGDPVVGSRTLATNLDHPTHVVVKMGVVAYADDVTPGDTSIVPLDELKLALGLDPLSTDDDLLLTLLESQAAAFVNSQTERNWGAPADRTEFIKGLGIPTLYLRGHVDGAIVSVRRRAMNAADFEDVDVADYIVRGDTLMTTGARWSHLYEYEVVYSDGYELGFAPADIRALVADLVAVAYSGLGEEGVKSETIGDYSYTLDSAVTAAAASMSDVSSATLNRYRAVHI